MDASCQNRFCPLEVRMPSQLGERSFQLTFISEIEIEIEKTFSIFCSRYHHCLIANEIWRRQSEQLQILLKNKRLASSFDYHFIGRGDISVACGLKRNPSGTS